MAIALLTVPSLGLLHAQTLDFAVSISTSAQREAFYTLAHKFESLHPGVTVKLTSFSSEVYKQKFHTLLTNKHNYDVLYWHSGERLLEHIRHGEISQISDIYSSLQWRESFDDSVLRTLTVGDQIYALPMSYYQIGFYYNKTLFTELSLSEPEDWPAFLAMCQRLKEQGIPPIFLGSNSNWPAMAWFDYVNLRINGIAFHHQLIAGNISFMDARVSAVLTALKTLIKAQYFNQDHAKMRWKQGLPPLFRGMIGVTMLGNYAIQDFPPQVTQNMGFFKFPLMGPSTIYQEEAPLDVFVLPAKSANKALARAFLQFCSQPDVQAAFNNKLGVISPNRFSQQHNATLVQQAYETLNGASDISQFFDRDAKADFAAKVMPIIDGFFSSPDIIPTQKLLELNRKKLFAGQEQFNLVED